MDKKTKKSSSATSEHPRLSSKRTQPSASVPPVVTVVGHVDHGKTTLLDAIRKTSIAQREQGGITQKIGASKIEFVYEGEKKRITFIDTPGHEAFMLMRGRGVAAADIGLLVISCADGIKPQTRESIKILKQSKIPFIAVLTKSDLPEKNIEKIKGELAKEEVVLEEHGGDVPVIEVSAKTNQNIQELLGLIILVSQVLNETKKVSLVQEFKGVVIESRQDPKKGPLATVIIKSGTITLRDEILADDIDGKVKNLTDANGVNLQSATIGEAVEVMGFGKSPKVGSLVLRKGSEFAHLSRDARIVDSKSQIVDRSLSERGLLPSSSQKPGSSFSSLENAQPSSPLINSSDPSLPPAVLNPFDYPDAPILSIILCADSYGSLEAIINALPPEIHIATQKTGEITPADILMAKSLGGIVIGFNIKIKPEIISLAKTEKILVKGYHLIYELIAELKDVLEGKTLAMQEEVLGMAKIVAAFPYEKTKVMGVAVTDGRVAKGDKVRIVRNDETIGETTISSLRHGKDQISKAEKGSEAGVIVLPLLDFTIGDVLISLG